MRKIYCFFLSLILLGLSACGKHEAAPENEILPDSGRIAVADFQQMRLPAQLEAFEQYATNGKWFYITKSVFHPEGGSTFQILRGKIASDYEGEIYLSKENTVCLALAADGENHCFVLWKQKNGIFLEKYDESGELLWHTEQDAPQLADIGRYHFTSDLAVKESAVTADGRLALCARGTENLVILFDENGNLLQINTSEPGDLDGLAAGRENRIYSYCITGDGDPVLTDIENPAQCYVLPFRPLQVFGGQEEGIYLSTSEGLWVFDPESSHTELKWRWADEYMNVDYQYLQAIYHTDGQWYLLCHTSDSVLIGGTTKVTMVQIHEESRADYGQKGIVTLGYVDIGVSQNLKMLVNLYNRQSKTYHVELAAYGDGQTDVTERLNEFELQLLRGDGPDIMDVHGIYVGILADKDIFCDLSDYYAGSRKVSGESILDVVWNGMRYKEKSVLVIPSFNLVAQTCEEPIAAEEWTPEKLIRLANEQEALWYFGTSAGELFTDCMGRFSEYERYIDYETGTSCFDCPEFRWILENCAQAGKEVTYPEALCVRSDESPAFLFAYYICDMAEYLWYSKNLKTMNCSWVGYPSWNGAVYLMQPSCIFAMNRKSENKEGAWDFLEYILSEECQNQIDWAFPVREDSFEQYLKTSYISMEDAEKMKEESFYSIGTFNSTEADFENIRYMVNHSIIQKASSPIRDILNEEAGMYFAGDATLDETVRKIDNRVQLYLNEK